jgi:MFS family permease
MRMSRFILITLCVCVGMLSGPGRASAKAAAANELPGKEIAQHISLLTGVALSPLMGVSGVGAWQYFKAKTPEQKAKLAWYANPLFFIPALLLVLLCFVKDTAGAALPTAVKKPFDIAETVEHKISGLVATGAFVPIAAAIFHAKTGGDGAALSDLGFAAIDLSWFYNALMVPISMAAFFVVFLASNAINVLIILSPFTTVDAALKGFRLALLGTVAGTALANPWIGAAWALIIILIAYFIAGWSFRLSHFGMVLTWDFFTFRSSRFTPNPAVNRLFLGRKITKVPARTYGKLSRDEKGSLVLNYRPWLVLPERTLVLPDGKYFVGKGVLFSEIQELQADTTKTALLLPPRYCGHEEELARIYGLTGVSDIGLRAAMNWIREACGVKAESAVT